MHRARARSVHRSQCVDVGPEGDGRLGLVDPLTPEQFDEKVKNLVTFLAYSANPVKLESQRIGTYVLLYLAFFFVFAYLLKREYWKDVH